MAHPSGEQCEAEVSKVKERLGRVPEVDDSNENPIAPRGEVSSKGVID